MSDKRLPVIEIFGPTIQGEGALCGQRSHFVRLGGCPRRCSWCDSLHAVLPEEIKKNAQRLTVDEIVSILNQIEIDTGKSRWVTLSGGDPLMWDLDELVTKLRARWNIAIETQGDFAPAWLRKVQLLTVSPKGPSAGQVEKTDYEVLKRQAEFIGTTDVVFKVVIFNDADFAYAKDLKQRFPTIRFYLSAGTDQKVAAVATNEALVYDICMQTKWLAEMALKEPVFEGAIVLPQMHVLMWPNQKGV